MTSFSNSEKLSVKCSVSLGMKPTFCPPICYIVMHHSASSQSKHDIKYLETNLVLLCIVCSDCIAVSCTRISVYPDCNAAESTSGRADDNLRQCLLLFTSKARCTSSEEFAVTEAIQELTHTSSWDLVKRGCTPTSACSDKCLAKPLRTLITDDDKRNLPHIYHIFIPRTLIVHRYQK